MVRPRIHRSKSEKKYLSYAYHRRRAQREYLSYEAWLAKLHSQGKDPEKEKAYFADDDAVSKKKFCRHRALAKFRGIEFDWEWEQWHQWWLDAGVDKNQTDSRRGADRLCMARYGDTGPYHPENVYCTTVAQNNTDAAANGRARGGRPRKSKG